MISSVLIHRSRYRHAPHTLLCTPLGYAHAYMCVHKSSTARPPPPPPPRLNVCRQPERGPHNPPDPLRTPSGLPQDPLRTPSGSHPHSINEQITT
eukprot:8616648-Pyramimonas_sp.AAC.1